MVVLEPRSRSTEIALIALLFPVATAAQSIAADRPGLDFSPATVAPGVIQVEIGLPALSYDGEDDADVWQFQMPSLVRIGIGAGAELRLGVSPYNVLTLDPGDAGAITERGVGDLELGAKVRLSDPQEGGPRIAVIPSITLPTGEAPFGSDGIGARLNAVIGFAPGDDVSLAAVGGLYYDRVDEGDWDASGLLALVGSRTLSGTTGVFLEVGALPAEGSLDAGLVGGGLSWLLSPDVQLDLYVDRGLGPSVPDWQFGTGASVRF